MTVEAVAEIEEEVIEEEVETEAVEEADPVETEEETSAEETEEVTEGDLVVSIGEESQPQEEEKAPEWVKELRVKQRETSKENKALKQKLEKYEQAKTVEVGVEPNIDDPDIDYDNEKFRKATQAYLSRKAEAEKEVEAKKEVEEVKAQAWQTTLNEFNEKREAVKAKISNYEELEGVVDDSLSEIQKGAILQCAKDPALLIAALGKNPAKLKELSSTKDAAQFIWAASLMESQMKVGSRKVATTPEKQVKGSGVSNALDATLDKLEKEADKTGDRSKVIAYKQKQKQT